MLGFQRGFDFTSVDLWSPAAADSSGYTLHRCKRNLCNLATFRASGQQLLTVQGPRGFIKATGLLNSVHSRPTLHRYTDCTLQACLCQYTQLPLCWLQPQPAYDSCMYLLLRQATSSLQLLHTILLQFRQQPSSKVVQGYGGAQGRVPQMQVKSRLPCKQHLAAQLLLHRGTTRASCLCV